MTSPNDSSEAPVRLQIDAGMGRSYFIPHDEVVRPSLVYTTVNGAQVNVEAEAGPNGALAQMNTRDLLVLQAFLSNAQTVVNIVIRRRNGMNDQVAPW